MALEEFVAGPYALSYKKPGGSSTALGLTEDGFELQFTPRGQNFEESAEYGASILDGAVRGHTASLLTKLLSFKKGVATQAYWQNNTYGNPLFLSPDHTVATASANRVGNLYSSFAGQIVAVALKDTPASAADAALITASATGNVFGTTSTLTIGYAYLAPGQAMAFQMTSKLRTLPLAYILLPYDTGTDIVYGVAS